MGFIADVPIEARITAGIADRRSMMTPYAHLAKAVAVPPRPYVPSRQVFVWAALAMFLGGAAGGLLVEAAWKSGWLPETGAIACMSGALFAIWHLLPD